MAEKSNGKSATDKRTIIEDGTEFKGTLAANCPVVVRGRVEGELTGPALEVTESGAVSGQVKVTELRSRGELTGTFEADDVVLSGRVRDETVIIAKALEVTPARAGAVAVELDDCELQIGEVPSKEQAVREALAGSKENEAAAPAATPPAPTATPS